MRNAWIAVTLESLLVAERSGGDGLSAQRVAAWCALDRSRADIAGLAQR